MGLHGLTYIMALAYTESTELRLTSDDTGRKKTKVKKRNRKYMSGLPKAPNLYTLFVVEQLANAGAVCVSGRF